ncbi:MAG: biopolymer transporter ExbD [Chitinophagales bacterium]|nr:biopolymer transporter ExbD [Chitinophagales bacterium]MDW8393460.1 biopolymer transporter ExbD [Chitinophagales bacterium]
MRFRRNGRHRAEVATSSLNDIMFMLLLFFLIVSTMINPSVIRLTLPRAKHTQQTVAKKMITLSVDRNLNYAVDDEPVPYPELESRLAAKLAGMADPTIVLRVDHLLTIQDVVDVIDIGTRLKAKMVLATQPKR